MTNPITPLMLRDDWPDRPSLSQMQKDLLGALSDEALQEALDVAFSRTSHKDAWYQMLDEVRGTATGILVEDLPDPKKARKGTKDECMSCGLPITAETGGTWRDDIMSSDVCPKGGEHTPAEATRKFQTSLTKAHAPKVQSIPTGSEVVLTLTTDGEDREDGLVYYARYLLVDISRGSLGGLEAVLDAITGGRGSVFRAGTPSTDDMFASEDLLADELTKQGYPAKVPHSSTILTQQRT